MSYVNDKWILSSCLQKSIRRGFSSLASNYFERLYAIDKSYSVYRLFVILNEDIGISNIQVLNNLANTNLKHDEIKKLGGLDFLFEIVEKSCVGHKDRSAILLDSFTKLPKQFILERFRNNLLELIYVDAYSIKELLSDTNSIYTDSCLRLSQILSDSDELTNTLKLSLPIPSLSYTSYFGYLSSLLNSDIKDGFSLGRIMAGTTVDCSVNSDVVNGILVDAIDWHTQIGKSLISKFCSKKSDTLEYLSSLVPYENEHAEIIGFLFFLLSGQVVNKPILYEASFQLFKVSSIIQLHPFINYNLDIPLLCEIFSKDIVLLRQLIAKQIS